MTEFSLPENVILQDHLMVQSGDALTSLNVKRWAVIADETVMSLYGASVLSSLSQAGLQGQSFSFPAGEINKTLDTYAALVQALSLSGFTRQDGILALGGGVCGDMAGFLAATYLRGIALVQMPTSLLAMVDSALGGKTGVDLPQGKNLIGTFYQPRKILIDPTALTTLPGREFASGLAEIIKYGMIADPAILVELEQESPDLTFLIGRCLSIKASLVSQDPQDLGIRRLLNFGHTYGHAYEAAGHYTLHTHGEAVAAGMAQMLRWEIAHGYPADQAYRRLLPLLTRYGLKADLPYTPTEIKSYLTHDKKSGSDTIAIAVVENIGSSRLVEIPLVQLWEDLL